MFEICFRSSLENCQLTYTIFISVYDILSAVVVSGKLDMILIHQLMIQVVPLSILLFFFVSCLQIFNLFVVKFSVFSVSLFVVSNSGFTTLRYREILDDVTPLPFIFNKIAPKATSLLL